MSDNAVVMWTVVMHMTLAFLALMCAGFLAYNMKAGWGWFIFAALIFGGISIKTKSDNEPKIDAYKEESK